MGQQTMHHDNSYGGVYGTLLSIVLFFVARFALSDIAAIFAILAGATTAGYRYTQGMKFIHGCWDTRRRQTPNHLLLKTRFFIQSKPPFSRVVK
jgi:hypothetical protein